MSFGTREWDGSIQGLSTGWISISLLSTTAKWPWRAQSSPLKMPSISSQSMATWGIRKTFSVASLPYLQLLSSSCCFRATPGDDPPDAHSKIDTKQECLRIMAKIDVIRDPSNITDSPKPLPSHIFSESQSNCQVAIGPQTAKKSTQHSSFPP